MLDPDGLRHLSPAPVLPTLEPTHIGRCWDERTGLGSKLDAGHSNEASPMPRQERFHPQAIWEAIHC